MDYSRPVSYTHLYIVGNEVDAQWEWQNMGYATLDEFVEQYEPALRIAYMAARKHYANARVYTSRPAYPFSGFESYAFAQWLVKEV